MSEYTNEHRDTATAPEAAKYFANAIDKINFQSSGARAHRRVAIGISNAIKDGTLKHGVPQLLDAFKGAYLEEYVHGEETGLEVTRRPIQSAGELLQSFAATGLGIEGTNLSELKIPREYLDQGRGSGRNTA